MPLYPCSCDDCGHTFEVLIVRSSQPFSAECPECQSQKVYRELSVPAKTTVPLDLPATNCAGTGPPCGAPHCGRRKM